MKNKKILLLSLILNVSTTQSALREGNPLLDISKPPHWHDMIMECALSCAIPAFTAFCLWQTISKTYYTSS